MRIWSIHPKYLDSKGLVAAWREGLLAKKVLEGNTTGYTYHPQLIRFRESENPLNSVIHYLEEIYKESVRRGYHFDRKKIPQNILGCPKSIRLTQGQVDYEFRLLKSKLRIRDLKKCNEIKNLVNIESNTLFFVVAGDIESWEKVKEID